MSCAAQLATTMSVHQVADVQLVAAPRSGTLMLDRLVVCYRDCPHLVDRCCARTGFFVRTTVFHLARTADRCPDGRW